MRYFEIAVGVIAALFTVGIVVGVLVVLALPGPPRRPPRPEPRPRPEPESWPADRGEDDTPPRWPGGTSA